MRTLFVLLAAMLALGSYFSSGGEPMTRSDADFEAPACRNKACRQHAPYLGPRTPGRDWPDRPPGYDPNCEMRRIWMGKGEAPPGWAEDGRGR